MTSIKAHFLPLTIDEFSDLVEKIRTKKPLITGLNVANQPFKIKAINFGENNLIIGQMLKSSDLDAVFNEVTFNLSFNDHKYFFKGLIKHPNIDLLGILIELTTEIYTIQRRAKERIQIPPEFYGMLKINYVNSKLDKSFSRVLNVSDTGCGLEFKIENNLRVKDIIQGDLSFPSRPPISIECEVVHKRKDQDPNGNIIYLLGLRYIFKKAQEEEQMNKLTIDLLRDIFTSQKKVA